MVTLSRRQFVAFGLVLIGTRAVSGIEEGDPAPHFVAQTLDGERITRAIH